MKRIFYFTLFTVCCLCMFPAKGFSLQGVSGTFFQTTKAVHGWTDDEWNTLFKTYKQLGIQEIIVQWTIYEDAYAQTDTENIEPSLETFKVLLSNAEANGIRVTVGGLFLSSYWERIKAEPDLIKVHLLRIRRGTVEAITQLAPVLAKSPSFAGWYISQEIDDRTWLNPTNREILCEFIAGLRHDLDSLIPEKPISISAFSNGWASPEKLGKFWCTVAEKTGLERVLFQDGVGAKKLMPSEVPLYLKGMQQEVASTACTIQPVVELFAQQEGTDFKAVSAPLKRIKQQLAVEVPYAPQGVILFSVTEYMSPLGGEKANGLLQEVLTSQP